MLKALSSNKHFSNFKCAEIFCVTPVIYNASCCLCGEKMPLQQFTVHFQEQHFTLNREEFNDELQENNFVKSKNNGDDLITDEPNQNEITVEPYNVKETIYKDCSNVKGAEEDGKEKDSNDKKKKTQNSVADKENYVIVNEAETQFLLSVKKSNDKSNKQCDENVNYRCRECNRCYSSKNNLRRHIRKVHGVGELQRQDQMSQIKNSNGRKIWTTEETWGFLSCYQRRKREFSHTRQKIYAYENVLDDMIAKGIVTSDTTVTMVEQKMRNLIKGFKTAKANKRQGRLCMFPFFEKMEEILSEKFIKSKSSTISRSLDGLKNSSAVASKQILHDNVETTEAKMEESVDVMLENSLEETW